MSTRRPASPAETLLRRHELLDAFGLLVHQIEDIHGPARVRVLEPNYLRAIRAERASAIWFPRANLTGTGQSANHGFHLDFPTTGSANFGAWGMPNGAYVNVNAYGLAITPALMHSLAVIVGLLPSELEA